jgi:hypothetical protein
MAFDEGHRIGIAKATIDHPVQSEAGIRTFPTVPRTVIP